MKGRKTAIGDNIYIINRSYWFRFTYKGIEYRERLGKVGELNKTTARNIAHKLKTQIIEGTYLPKKEENLTFEDLAEEYLKWYMGHHHNTKESTKLKHRHIINKLLKAFGSIRVKDITTFRIEQYKQDRLKEKASPKTVNNELSMLRAILRKGKELGLISIELPKIKLLKISNERVRYLTIEEFDRLIGKLPEWLKSMVEFAVHTGLRAGEIISLKWDYVDWEAKTLALPSELSKNKEIAHIPLTPTAIQLLTDLKTKQEKEGISHGYIFTNSQGKPYKEGGYRRAFNNALKKAGIKDFRFHDLRHTFASWLAMKGIDLYTIQHLTRHKSTAMVKRYAHLSPEHLRKAIQTIEELGFSKKPS